MKAGSQGRWLESPGARHGREKGQVGETLRRPSEHVRGPGQGPGLPGSQGGLSGEGSPQAET